MFSDADKLALVKASPQAVAVHDKAAWLDLFSHDALVNDPVGSAPHTSHTAISRFYDSFIAPNDIRFDADQDIVCGMTVVRDLTIVTRLPTGLEAPVATHICYELKQENDQLKIHRLYAHWELMPMVLNTLSAGFIGLRSYVKLSVRMVQCQGVGGVLGFMRGFLGGGRGRRKKAENFLSRLAQNDAAGAKAMLAADAVLISAPDTNMAVEQLAAEMQGMRWHKVLAGGDRVTASIRHQDKPGVMLMVMNRQKRITQVVLYL